MSSERPGGPADVVPGDRCTRETASATGGRRGRRAGGERGRPPVRAVAGASEAEEGLPAARAAGAAARRVRPGAGRQDLLRAGVLHPVRLDGADPARLHRLHGRPRPGQQGPVLVRRAGARRHRRLQGPRHLDPRGDRRPSRATGSAAPCSGWAAPSASRRRARTTSSSGSSPSRARPCSAATPRAGSPSTAQPLDEPYIFEDTPIESRAFGPVTVPEGRLWVMGDHRSASADSKAHMGDQYSGTIGVDDVIGKAAMIVWPVSRFGTARLSRHPGHRGRVRRRRRRPRRPMPSVWPGPSRSSPGDVRGARATDAPTLFAVPIARA